MKPNDFFFFRTKTELFPLKIYEPLHRVKKGQMLNRSPTFCDAFQVVAVGECGLDYDRLQFCDIAVQKRYFEMQLQLSAEFNLPLFLHHRNCHQDFRQIIEDNLQMMPRRGVVHSFDGTLEQAQFFIHHGMLISH